MQIRLNNEEIRKALSEALSQKLNHIYNIEMEDCWFDVESAEGPINDVEFINFNYEIDTEKQGSGK